MGSHCFECLKAATPPLREQVHLSLATAGPVVTKAFIALNVVVAVLGLLSSGGSWLSGRLTSGLFGTDIVLFGPAVADGQIYRLLTAGFLHYGPIHLGFNMLIIWRMGALLEGEIGHLRFASLYLAALLAGSAGALVVSPNSLTGGASGAAFGLVAAAAISMRNRGIDVWASGIGPLLAINLFFTFTIRSISVGGHVGGLLGGALVGVVMLAPASGRAQRGGLVAAVAVGAAAVAIGLATTSA